MIDEHKEELSAMYALGIMEPGEARAFEAELRSDAELRKLVDDLLRSSAAMVHTCPAKAAPSHLKEKILNRVRSQITPEAGVVKGGENNKVLPFLRPMSLLPWAMAAGFMAMCCWLFTDRIKLQNYIVDLQNKNDVCQMQVALLDPMNDNAHGVATIVWDSSTQTGVLDGQDMPRPAANQDYQLWMKDDQYQQPVDAGVVKVDEKGKAKAMFKPKQKVSSTCKFAISIEKKGGMPQPEGPIVMTSGKK